MRPLLSLLVVVVTLLVPPALMAQALDEFGLPTHTHDPAQRTLTGFRFIPSPNAPSPFITTHLRTGVGFGTAFDVPTLISFPPGSPIDTLSSDLGFVGLDVGYQQGLLDYVALRVGLSGFVRIGTNDDAVIAEGISAIWGANVGASIRILRTKNVIFTLTGDYKPAHIIGISPGGVIDSNGMINPEDLVQDDNTYQFSGGGRAAWAPWHWIGLTGVVEVGGGDSFLSEELDSFWTWGGSVQTDFTQFSPIPIGILFTGERFTFLDIGGSGVDSVSDDWGLGIFYTGRHDFSIGGEFRFADVPRLGDEDVIETNFLTIEMQYFF